MRRDTEVSLLIIADDLLAGAGLAALLAGQTGLHTDSFPKLCIAGQSDSGPRLDMLVQDHAPDVLLWDLGWGLDETDNNPVLARLAVFASRLPVLALLAEKEDAGAVWSMGVAGLLSRQVGRERLAAGIYAVANGVLVLDASQRSLLGTPIESAPPELLESLTPREKEVLALLADGLTNRAIAHRLAISENTVKFHVQSLLGKLDAQSRTDAVVRATRLGLLLL